MAVRRLIALALGLGACTFAPSGGGGECTPGCDGLELTTCSGGEPTTETCAVACVATPAPHCGQRLVSNLDRATLDRLLGATTAGLTFPVGTYTIDTDTGAIVVGSGPVPFPRDGTAFEFVPPKAAVLVVNSLTLPAGVVLKAVGTRALMVVARGAIDVGGTIDLSAGCQLATDHRCGGPGGGDGGQMGLAAKGCAFGHNGAMDGGGAGGGFGSRGGVGGRGNGQAVAQELAGCAGTAGNPLVPLTGGSGGGAGAGGARGGGGGGAIQLSALGDLRVSGILFVGGDGGAGGSGNTGGGGGGAGGGILLEGVRVVIDGARLLAAGGGGGGGRNGGQGSDARLDEQAAFGGTSSGGGDGGDGAIETMPGEPGVDGGGPMNDDGGGGGGGGVGQVRIDTGDGRFTVPATTLVHGVVSIGVMPAD